MSPRTGAGCTSRAAGARAARHRTATTIVVCAAAWLTTACSDLVAKRAHADPPPTARISASSERIAAEAEVFRTRPGDLELDTTRFRRPAAHPRTLANFRALRAYPGAPPVIPHGLAAGEFRSEGCRTCHERGGYSLRFGAYVPVTPHPELSDCLSCHLPNDAVVGIAPPPVGSEGDCHQCHAAGGFMPTVGPPGWRALTPPEIRPLPPGELPPPIPHDLAMRRNCNGCHMGPGAVKEIRTRHPERSDCRSCHVAAASGDSDYSRPGSTR